MHTVLYCLVYQHDLRLVALAVVICGLASFTAFTLIHHVRKTSGQMRTIWLGVATVATGFGIWATHFIAMLAFTPGIPSAYNITLTLISLLAAIVLTGAGLSIALSAKRAAGQWAGGAVVGGGIAALHYTGMAAFEIAGRVVWNPSLVASSIILGAVLGAVALPTGLRGDQLKWRIFGGLLLTAAIASHHFTAMGAVTIVPDPTVVLSQWSVPTSWLAIAVAFASAGILVLAFAGLWLEMREHRLGELENDRMRGLANATVEGLLVCDGETIAAINTSFATLAGVDPSAALGSKLRDFFPDEVTRLKLLARVNQPIEADLRQVDGSTIPVEIIMRPVEFNRRPHQAVAVRDLRARKEAEQHIRYLAHHDALTGLPNRSSFNKKLDQDIEATTVSGQRMAVLCLDLDRFKEVNDLFGHAAGDTLLQTVARTVSGILDPKQMMARLGGDEFAIILPGIDSPSTAGRVAENILDVFKAESVNSATAAQVSVSIGIAIFPSDATDRQGLLTNADTALYRAKTDGRGTYRFFEARLGAEVQDRRLLEHELRQAIAKKELSLVFQPEKDVKTGEVSGFEALLRWKHASRGVMEADAFVPIAEESGTILAIGEWALRSACHEAASWQRPLHVAVNVSPLQLHSANFARLVHDILQQTGLEPRRLELDVTETALLRDMNRALITLRQLKAIGVRVAMDDFGTGFSSLSNLNAFPFDKIKIDGSFIKSVDVNDKAAAIVRAVLGLGRGLGVPVLAEGVEEAGEMKFLVEERCDEVQGHLFGGPSEIGLYRNLTHGTGGEPTATGKPALRVVGSN